MSSTNLKEVPLSNKSMTTKTCWKNLKERRPILLISGSIREFEKQKIIQNNLLITIYTYAYFIRF